MNDKSLWGSVECPFELAPRWLTAPHEVSVDLVSASSPGTLSLVESYALTLRHTVKQFGTVKVRFSGRLFYLPSMVLVQGNSNGSCNGTTHRAAPRYLDSRCT